MIVHETPIGFWLAKVLRQIFLELGLRCLGRLR